MYDKLKILHTMGAQITPEGAKDILGGLYGALTALDETASALLIFDGILITAAAFAAERRNGTGPERMWALGVIFIALVAAVFCLLVAQISYPFLHYVVVTPGTPGGADFSKEFEVLDGEVMRRTFLFGVAWWLSLLAVAIPLFLILVGFLRDIPYFLRRVLRRG